MIFFEECVTHCKTSAMKRGRHFAGMRFHGAQSGSNGMLRGWWDRVWLALVWRYVCHCLMVLISIMNEGVDAPSLHDRVIAMVPYVAWIGRYNYHLWLLCYVPVAAWLWRVDRDRFVQFLYAGGVLSLLRGISIFVTVLGPVSGVDMNAGASTDDLIRSWLAIINPVSALTSDVTHIYLTKDLFFSGHTASTFLLWLYCRRFGILSRVALACHLIVVASVFLCHLHYTIDVIGAYAVTFSLYVLAERGFDKIRRQVV